MDVSFACGDPDGRASQSDDPINFIGTIRAQEQSCEGSSTKNHPTYQKLSYYHSPTISSIIHHIPISLILILTFTTYCGISDHVANLPACEAIEQVVEPKVILNETLSSSLGGIRCDTNLRLFIAAFGDSFVIDLVKNKRLISEKYFKYSQDQLGDQIPQYSNRFETKQLDDFHRNHRFLNLHNFTSNDDHCHYHGLVNNNLNSVSAISILDNKLLAGYFHDEFNSYELISNRMNFTTKLIKSCALNIENVHTRVRRDTKARPSPTNPDNHIRHGPFNSNPDSLYVELLVLHDHSQYVEYKGDASNIAERTMQIVNIMNAFYRQLNIFVALVGVVLWVEKDEIELTEDGDATLTNFLKYRYDKLLPRYHHDNAQLITSTSFNGSVVGKALKGPICTHEHSGGVNTDHSHSAAIVAVTLAHELGHNFGMEHDEEEKCKCPDEKCIMSASSSLVHPKLWSSCSIEYLEDAKKHGLLDCLLNEPEKVFGPICGNGFVEDGEDCDLGEPLPSYGSSKSRSGSKCAKGGQDCDQNTVVNHCCNRQTCKFALNATCAQGPCCDLANCSVYTNMGEPRVCRPKRRECDLEELCDGKSEYCPDDVHYHDGIECGPTSSSDGQQPVLGSETYNRSRAYCYNGRCASHESQCRLLWGPSGSSSDDICYEQNIHGNTSGNCGYKRTEKVYENCEPEDAICGMLHCVHNQPSGGDFRKTGKLGYGFESASILTVSFFVSHHTKIFCHGAIVDAGPSVRDPGLVPNGAACGDGRMCLNQKCVPVEDVIYGNSWCPSDCNGNGVCDNLGVCHCHDGTVGTSCYQFFGSNFHLSLLLYMIFFFVPMIALIVFAINHYRNQIKLWWFLHNRKIALRNKSQEPSQQRRLTYEPGSHKVSISEPIPLNQHSNANRPFYEPNQADPWADSPTSADAAARQQPFKSPGYRLEPLPNQSAASGLLLTKNAALAANNMRPIRSAPLPPTQNR